MKKKIRRGKRNWKSILLNKWVVLTIIAILIVTLLVYYFLFFHSTTMYEAVPHTAAIVDQVSMTHPNATLISRINNTLTSAGFSVDYYNYSQVTVDFYRQLPSKRYSLIILRVHSGVGQYSGLTSLYTSESYSDWAYYREQMNTEVVAVKYVDNGPKYFAITSNLVKMSDGCKNSLVIMMGCDGLKKDDMAKAYSEKGAIAYISWNGSVTPYHTDNAVDELLRNLVSKNQTIRVAISNTMTTVGPDPEYNSQLTYYPSEAQDIRVTELSTNSQQHYSSSFVLNSLFFEIVANNTTSKKLKSSSTPK